MQSRRTFALWLFLFCLISPLAVTQVYKVTDLGPLAPTAINDWGQVAGNLNGHAFIWTKWGRLDLGTLAGGTFSSAAAINDFGAVAGTADGIGTVVFPDLPDGNVACSNLTQPFVWTPRHGMKGLGTVAFFDAFPWTAYPCGIPYFVTGSNAPGQIVGYTGETASFQWAFVSANAGGMTSLFARDWPPTSANAVSNTGQIVGQYSVFGGPGYAVSRKNGVTVDLGTLIGGVPPYSFYSSSANDVNDRGQIVGWSDTLEGFFHAVLWTASGAIQDLGTLQGDTLSVASKINLFGQVIGASGNTAFPTIRDLFGEPRWSEGVSGRAFIWTQRGGMQDLNTLIPANSGWVLSSATGINLWGQIVGSGTRNGQPHGFLLTPRF